MENGEVRTSNGRRRTWKPLDSAPRFRERLRKRVRQERRDSLEGQVNGRVNGLERTPPPYKLGDVLKAIHVIREVSSIEGGEEKGEVRQGTSTLHRSRGQGAGGREQQRVAAAESNAPAFGDGVELRGAFEAPQRPPVRKAGGKGRTAAGNRAAGRGKGGALLDRPQPAQTRNTHTHISVGGEAGKLSHWTTPTPPSSRPQTQQQTQQQQSTLGHLQGSTSTTKSPAVVAREYAAQHAERLRLHKEKRVGREVVSALVAIMSITRLQRRLRARRKRRMKQHIEQERVRRFELRVVRYSLKAVEETLWREVDRRHRQRTDMKAARKKGARMFQRAWHCFVVRKRIPTMVVDIRAELKETVARRRARENKWKASMLLRLRAEQRELRKVERRFLQRTPSELLNERVREIMAKDAVTRAEQPLEEALQKSLKAKAREAESPVLAQLRLMLEGPAASPYPSRRPRMAGLLSEGGEKQQQ